MVHFFVLYDLLFIHTGIIWFTKGGSMEQKIKSEYTLGKRIRKLRLESGFHVTELARYMQLAGCDTTRECLVKIEAGKHHISVLQLKTIKEALNVTYEQIFEDLTMEE